MTELKFVSWVEPVASSLAADLTELLEFAQRVPLDAWDTPTAVEGWTCKHILAHLAGGNDQLLQATLRRE